MYVRARYLRTDLGRWMTVDRIWPMQKAYAYVENTPEKTVDPSGLQNIGTMPNSRELEELIKGIAYVLGIYLRPEIIAAIVAILLVIIMIKALQAACKEVQTLYYTFKGLYQKLGKTCSQMSPFVACCAGKYVYYFLWNMFIYQIGVQILCYILNGKDMDQKHAGALRAGFYEMAECVCQARKFPFCPWPYPPKAWVPCVKEP